MKKIIQTIGLLGIGMISCSSPKKATISTDTFSDINVVGAMKNVMWKGELGSSINLDTISDKIGLYGLGPVSYLKGELLINDGKSYVGRVTSDSTMEVEQNYEVSAPFFVYAHVNEWTEIDLDSNIRTIPDLENLIDEKASEFIRPFAFKLIGKVASTIIHLQNLPEGSKVSSPDEAHQGQINYELRDEDVVIVGFFSKEHKGVFTHHDSFLHMHLITKDEKQMGHLDKLEIENMKLFLPNK